MNKLAGFDALPHQWLGLLTFMSNVGAKDQDFINAVHGRTPEEQIVFLWYAWGNKRKIARLIQTKFVD